MITYYTLTVLTVVPEASTFFGYEVVTLLILFWCVSFIEFYYLGSYLGAFLHRMSLILVVMMSFVKLICCSCQVATLFNCFCSLAVTSTNETPAASRALSLLIGTILLYSWQISVLLFDTVKWFVTSHVQFRQVWLEIYLLCTFYSYALSFSQRSTITPTNSNALIRKRNDID